MDLQEIEKTGLIIRKENELKYFDRFRGRIMFPVFDETGHVIAFSGRILEKHENEAKYMNSPESPIFQKSHVLYNLDKARLDIRKQRNVIVFEGFLDVIAASKAGIENGIATMGTALTSSHITKLNRLTSHVTLCFDGDRAGMEAAKKLLLLYRPNKYKRRLQLFRMQWIRMITLKTMGKKHLEQRLLKNHILIYHL